MSEEVMGWSLSPSEQMEYLRKDIRKLKAENAKLRKVIDDITEVVEVSDPALVRFIAKRMKRIRTEEDA